MPESRSRAREWFHLVGSESGSFVSASSVVLAHYLSGLLNLTSLVLVSAASKWWSRRRSQVRSP
ncbi:hypothetical protein BDW71DRAFT_74473 [Aspergillus fruticulosus]